MAVGAHLKADDAIHVFAVSREHYYGHRRRCANLPKCLEAKAYVVMLAERR